MRASFFGGGCDCDVRDVLRRQSEKISAIVQAAGVSVDSYYPAMFAKACESVDIEKIASQMCTATPSAGGGGGGGAAAPAAGGAAAEEKAPEPKEEEEEEEEAEFDLFD